MKFIFGMQINIEVFKKLLLLYWTCGTRYTQSTQNFAYLSKSMEDEVHYSTADKHGSFLQVDSITLGVHSQAYTKYPKQQVYNVFAISQGNCEG